MPHNNDNTSKTHFTLSPSDTETIAGQVGELEIIIDTTKSPRKKDKHSK